MTKSTWNNNLKKILHSLLSWLFQLFYQMYLLSKKLKAYFNTSVVFTFCVTVSKYCISLIPKFFETNVKSLLFILLWVIIKNFIMRHHINFKILTQIKNFHIYIFLFQLISIRLHIFFNIAFIIHIFPSTERSACLV